MWIPLLSPPNHRMASLCVAVLEQEKIGYFLLKSQKWSLQIYKILASKKMRSTRIFQPNLQSTDRLPPPPLYGPLVVLLAAVLLDELGSHNGVHAEVPLQSNTKVIADFLFCLLSGGQDLSHVIPGSHLLLPHKLPSLLVKPSSSPTLCHAGKVLG